jgi:signal transduction histidine kinase
MTLISTLKRYFLVAAFFWGVEGSALAQTEDSSEQFRRVLIVFSHRNSLPVSQQYDRGIRESLETHLDSPAAIDVEHLDFDRLISDQQREKWFDLLTSKYQKLRPDLIILVHDSGAVPFLTDYQHFFPTSSIVICSLNAKTLPKLTISSKMTGVLYQVGYRRTLELAMNLFPNLAKVVVVSGDWDFEHTVLSEFQAEFAGRTDIAFDYWIDLPVETLCSKARQLPPDCIILYFVQHLDSDGRSTISPREVAGRLSEASSVPVFGLYDTLLGTGIIGGFMIPVEEQGKRAGEIAARILDGESPSNIPFEGTEMNRFMVDWRQLKRWDIDENRLPEETQIFFRQPSYWEKNAIAIFSGLALFGLQSLLVVGLWLNRRHRISAQRELADRLQFERLLSEISSRFIDLSIEQLPREFEFAIRKVLKFNQLDFGVIYQLSGTTLQLRTTVCLSPGSEFAPPREINQDEAPGLWQSSSDSHASGIATVTPSAGCSQESGPCRLLGCEGCFILPLTVHGSLIGIVVFGRMEQAPEESGDMTQRLRLVSELLASVLARAQAEQVLTLSRENAQRLAGKVITAQEDERRRLAREIHDEISQRLAVAAMECGRLQQATENPSELTSVLSKLFETLIKLSSDVHELSRRLHPAILDDLGLRDAVTHQCDEINSQGELSVCFHCGNLPSNLPQEIQTCVYRAAQEGLRNITKHSRASRAELTLSADPESVYFQIRDNGCGLPEHASHRSAGLGLVAMEERVRLLGGEFQLLSSRLDGTCITLNLPLPSHHEGWSE